MGILAHRPCRPCHPERRRRSRRSRRIPLAALRPQRAHEPQATPDQKRLVQVSCGWPRAERARAPCRRPQGRGPAGTLGLPVHLFASFVRPRHEVRSPRARRPGSRTGRRRGSRDNTGLRPAETSSPLPWGRRGGPSRPPSQGTRPRRIAARDVQKSRKDAPHPPPNCHGSTKVRKKCTAPPQPGDRPAGAHGPRRADTTGRRPRRDASGPDRRPLSPRRREVAHFSRFVARVSMKRLFAHVF